jgi:patatin-like phospholipase/acyl hydrolase
MRGEDQALSIDSPFILQLKHKGLPEITFSQPWLFNKVLHVPKFQSRFLSKLLRICMVGLS